MKLNKIFNLIIILLTLCAFTCRETRKIKKITVLYVNVELETPFQVQCGDYENLFLGSYKTVVINDVKELNEFADYLTDCHVSDSAQNIDVRVKAVVAYLDGKTATLCMDKFNDIILDNKLINTNKNIVAFIKKQIHK